MNMPYSFETEVILRGHIQGNSNAFAATREGKRKFVLLFLPLFLIWFEAASAFGQCCPPSGPLYGPSAIVIYDYNQTPPTVIELSYVSSNSNDFYQDGVGDTGTITTDGTNLFFEFQAESESTINDLTGTYNSGIFSTYYYANVLILPANSDFSGGTRVNSRTSWFVNGETYSYMQNVDGADFYVGSTPGEVLEIDGTTAAVGTGTSAQVGTYGGGISFSGLGYAVGITTSSPSFASSSFIANGETFTWAYGFEYGTTIYDYYLNDDESQTVSLIGTAGSGSASVTTPTSSGTYSSGTFSVTGVVFGGGSPSPLTLTASQLLSNTVTIGGISFAFASGSADVEWDGMGGTYEASVTESFSSTNGGFTCGVSYGPGSAYFWISGYDPALGSFGTNSSATSGIPSSMSDLIGYLTF